MKTFVAAILSLALVASTATAAEKVGPLPPGKPAGVKPAQSSDNTTLYVLLGVGAIVTIGAVVASSNSNGTPLQTNANAFATGTTA